MADGSTVEETVSANKISILEAENETLKEELTIIQDALNEMQFKNIIKNMYNIASDDIEEVAKEYLKIYKIIINLINERVYPFHFYFKEVIN